MSDLDSMTEGELDAEIARPLTQEQMFERVKAQIDMWRRAACRLQKIVILSREFVEAQTPLAGGDFAAPEFDKLSSALTKLHPPGTKTP